MTPSSRNRLALACIILLYLLLGLASMNDMIIYTPDSARYLVWSMSLPKGEGFRDATGPEPSRYVVHAPLYSVLLAPAAWLAPGSVVGAKVTTLLIGCVVLILVYRWLRQAAGETAGLIGTGLLALHPLMFMYSTQVLSDVPFAVCVVLFLLLIEDPDEASAHSVRREAGLLLVIIAGIFLREVGLTLMLAGVAITLMRRQYQRAARILLVSVLFYLLWYVRNEAIVASIEHPPMRNTHVFFTHYFTPANTSLLVELGTRFVSNLTVYARLIPRLLLYPDLGGRTMSVVAVSDPLIRAVTNLLPVGQFLLGGMTLLLAGVGGWTAAQRWKAFPVAMVFLVFYLGPILFYPINDIRFLFPVLLLLVFLVVLGFLRTREIAQGRVGSAALGTLALILVVPNLVWVQSYVRNSSGYRASPEQFAAAIVQSGQGPELFAKPLSVAGRWIADHSDPSTVILTRWKELALWTEGRKIIDADPESTPDQFDSYLRIYDVGFLVSTVSRAGLREHEFLCERSLRFAFETVFRSGNVEVMKVLPREAAVLPVLQAGGETNRIEFARALQLLDGGRPAEAETLLTQLGRRLGRYGAIIFHIGVAKEFAGRLDDAADEFARFRFVPQAGSYIQQAWYHQEIIARVRTAEASTNPEERADRLHVVGINYWELGFRGQALRMLDRAIGADSGFYPAIIFSAIFRYQVGDAEGAKTFLRHAREIGGKNLLSISLANVLSLTDSLALKENATGKSAIRLRRAQVLIAMGLRDAAIDDLRAVLAVDPESREALHQLAAICMLKRYEAPAMQILERLERLGALTPEESAQVAELRKRWR